MQAQVLRKKQALFCLGANWGQGFEIRLKISKIRVKLLFLLFLSGFKSRHLNQYKSKLKQIVYCFGLGFFMLLIFLKFDILMLKRHNLVDKSINF